MSKPDNKPLEDAFSAGDMVDAPAPLAAVEAGPVSDIPRAVINADVAVALKQNALQPEPSELQTVQEPNTTEPVVNPASLPLKNSNEELFVENIFKGMSHYTAYQRFISPKAGKETASKEASILFHRPDVEFRYVYLRAQVAITPQNAIDNNELRRIMSVIARSGCPNERIAASKQLRDWIKEDNQAAAARRIADPALACEHLAGLRAAAPKMPPDERIQFARQTVAGLSNLLHMEPADWQAALAPDRIGTPLSAEKCENIEENAD